MKLKNKKTGEIVEITIYKTDDSGFRDVFSSVEGEGSLTEFNEAWEDYEKPKDFWYIDDECGIMYDSTDPNLWNKKYAIEFMKQIGNHFETEEEAEKAVEKLKAWKRLRDKGFRFVEWQQHGITEDGVMDGAVYFEDVKNADRKDLDLLFGGEE